MKLSGIVKEKTQRSICCVHVLACLMPRSFSQLLTDRVEGLIHILLILLGDFCLPWNGCVNTRRIHPVLWQRDAGFRLPAIIPGGRKGASDGPARHFQPDEDPGPRHHPPYVVSAAAYGNPSALTVRRGQVRVQYGGFHDTSSWWRKDG